MWLKEILEVLHWIYVMYNMQKHSSLTGYKYCIQQRTGDFIIKWEQEEAYLYLYFELQSQSVSYREILDSFSHLGKDFYAYNML